MPTTTEQEYIDLYFIDLKYDRIAAQYRKRPREAIRDLEALIKEYESGQLVDHLVEVLASGGRSVAKAPVVGAHYESTPTASHF